VSGSREEPAVPAPAPEAAAPAEIASPAATAPAESPVETPPPATAPPEAPAAAPPLENLLSGGPGEASAAPAEKPAAEAPSEAPPEAPAPAYEWQPFAVPEDLKDVSLAEEPLAALRETLTAPDISPQERGQRLLDLHIAEMRAHGERTLERQIETFQEMQRGWIDRFKGDPEIGGAAAQTHLALANAAIRRFAQEDQRHGRPLPAANGAARESDHSALMDALRITGAVNHPEIVRYFARVEAFMREPARAAPAIGPSAVPRDVGNRRPSAQGGNPGRGAPRMRDMYDNPRSQEVFNGSSR
jgi:hypothetical protein